MPFSRSEAPGELRPLEQFCNSAQLLHAEDALVTPVSATTWLRHHELDIAELTRKDHERLVGVRETIRDYLGGHDQVTELNRLAKTLLNGPRWSADGAPILHYRRTDGLDAYLGALLALLFTADLTGNLTRLKTCRNPDCRWVFYDRSPGRNSVWCSMDICGARYKMRAYRSRHAQ